MFAIQIVSKALFYHSHVLNGKVLSHSHPGCDGHSHSEADFTFYQQLQNIVSEETPNLLSDVLPLSLQKVFGKLYAGTSSKYIQNNSDRAPPVA